MTVKQNKRRHIRLMHRAEISLLISNAEPLVAKMRDFSDSGLYLLGHDNKVAVGDIVSVRTLEFEDAPVQRGKVVRIEPGDGFAIEFVT